MRHGMAWVKNGALHGIGRYDPPIDTNEDIVWMSYVENINPSVQCSMELGKILTDREMFSGTCLLFNT
jgi:hypothetical protein